MLVDAKAGNLLCCITIMSLTTYAKSISRPMDKIYAKYKFMVYGIQFNCM